MTLHATHHVVTFHDSGRVPSSLRFIFAISPTHASLQHNATPSLSISRYADLAWERFSAHFSYDGQGQPVVEGGESVAVQWTHNQPWMYFYNVPPVRPTLPYKPNICI